MLSCVRSLIGIVLPCLVKPKKVKKVKKVIQKSAPYVPEYQFFHPLCSSILRTLTPAQKDGIPWVCEFNEEYGMYRWGTKQYEYLSEILWNFSEEVDRAEVDARIASIIQMKRHVKANHPPTPAWRSDEIAYFEKYCVAHGYIPIPDDPDDTWNYMESWFVSIEDGLIEDMFADKDAVKSQCEASSPSKDDSIKELFTEAKVENSLKKECPLNEEPAIKTNITIVASEVMPEITKACQALIVIPTVKQIILTPALKKYVENLANKYESDQMSYATQYFEQKRYRTELMIEVEAPLPEIEEKNVITTCQVCKCQTLIPWEEANMFEFLL